MAAWLSAGLLFASAPARADQPLTLAVNPYLPTTEVAARFTPLAARLGAALGHKARVVVAENYEQHIQTVGAGRADIAYLGPVSYVQLRNEYGPQHLLARQANQGIPTFHGAIIVREDSALETLSDLKGTRFAFGDPASTMNHVVPRVMLHDAGVDVTDLAGYDFVGSHKTVAFSVLTGKFDAGGVKMEAFEQFKNRGLRALAVSDAISEHVFVAGPGLTPAQREKARAVLLGLHADQAGLDALRAIKPTLTALVPAGDADYDALRRTLQVFERLTAKSGAD